MDVIGGKNITANISKGILKRKPVTKTFPDGTTVKKEVSQYRIKYTERHVSITINGNVTKPIIFTINLGLAETIIINTTTIERINQNDFSRLSGAPQVCKK